MVSPHDRAPGGLACLGPDDVAPLAAAIESALNDASLLTAARRLESEIARTPTLEQTLCELLPVSPAA